MCRDGTNYAAALAAMCAEKPVWNAVCSVVTGVMSAATSPSAATGGVGVSPANYVTKFVTHA